jgi:hypothetical protein
MENSFIPQAIDVVGKAIDADNAGEYEKALSLYRDALSRFTLGLKYEKNEARKKLILERVEGYMKRAEELRDYVAKQNELDKAGGGGAATRKAGDGNEEDSNAEKKKLRGALAGAIVQEKPNIKWEDVAGLENAKESLKEVSGAGIFLEFSNFQFYSRHYLNEFLSSFCFRPSFFQLAFPSYSRESVDPSRGSSFLAPLAPVRVVPDNLNIQNQTMTSKFRVVM